MPAITITASSASRVRSMQLPVAAPGGSAVRGGLERLEGGAVEAVDRPVVDRSRAERLVEANRAAVPVEHRPLHPAAAARRRDLRDVAAQAAADPLAAKCRAH